MSKSSDIYVEFLQLAVENIWYTTYLVSTYMVV